MLTVVTPRESLQLVTVDAFKTEMQISDSASDAYISDMLDRASQLVEGYCQQVFSVEQVREDFRVRCSQEFLDLSRFPVISIDAVEVDGVEWTGDLAEQVTIDKARGRLYRFDSTSDWWNGLVAVTYTAGYATIPAILQEAVLRMGRSFYPARTRDPGIKSENILDGLYAYTLFDSASAGGGKSGLPQGIEAMLSPYVNFKGTM